MRALRSSRGQFIPITWMLIFTSIVLLVVVINVYRVTRAKLLAQNIADAAALAIASMEAKEINVVVDRNEWLNHMYPSDAPHSSNQLPNISDANHWHEPGGTDEAKQYAQLVATINQAQMMFRDAYDRFMGATSQSANAPGIGGLADVLKEIDGLQDPSVQLIVFNTQSGSNQADNVGQLLASGAVSPNSGGGANGNIYGANNLSRPPIDTEDIRVTTNDHGKVKTLSQILGINDPTQKVGWMHPNWNSSDGLKVNVTPGQSKTTIGAGAICVKTVRLLMPFVGTKAVRARATAYVVQGSGLSADPNDRTKPPPTFRPTYYVRLGVPQ